MRKTGLVFLLTLVLCFTGSLTAFGRTEGHVFDEAGLYTQEEAADLTSRAEPSGNLWDGCAVSDHHRYPGIGSQRVCGTVLLDGGFGYGEEKTALCSHRHGQSGCPDGHFRRRHPHFHGLLHRQNLE